MLVTSVVLGAPRTAGVAAFYARLLGWPVIADEPARPGMPPEDGWAMLRSPDARGVMAIAVQWEPDYAAPVWPPRPGEQAMILHLDIQTADVDTAVAWAVECGATIAGAPAAGPHPGAARPGRTPVLPVPGPDARRSGRRGRRLSTAVAGVRNCSWRP
jgi:hypothetical protein